MKRLYTPFKVNKLELKNRVIMSPMSIGHTVDGFIMDDVVEFYKRRAQGGVGLIIFANMQWDKLRYNPNHGAMLTDEKYIPSLKKLTDAIHEGGSKVFAQLMHRGRCANRASIQGEQAVAPSPIPGRFTHFEMPKELTVEEIKEFVDWQAEAAVIAKKAGFDGIEMSKFFVPRITTIEQPIDEIARESVRVLMDMLENGRPHRRSGEGANARICLIKT
mgnify:CR=1 FL=1